MILLEAVNWGFIANVVTGAILVLVSLVVGAWINKQ